ncbi:MAG TPA: UDP-N-acetylmuramate:L-alanyl-gamma-D-glutamyl-meso-diaminopimelate ligase [Candidatus Polarisedimenticolia bacterium]|nr:UDP-N-acetylmuramate:L-alanyl-gamma-D-glutamyl-meso-diaminopimelate ligase [Candidatus Polarisedimenticolia bacterium]
MLIHMIGICGTGMGSLAGLLSEAGHTVRGSDENVYPPVSTLLQERGIPILQGYKAAHIAGDGPRPDLVVVGNIANQANPEVQALLQSGIEYLSMPQAIARFFLASRHPVVVAGTHGKTTTTAMIARMLMESGRDPSFLVGGVLRDLGSSYRLGKGSPNEPFVIEGDEYETSFFDKGPKFLHYMPRTAVLTSVEYDHAEMFPSLEAVQEAFRSFVALVPPAAGGGCLAVCADDPLAAELGAACRGRIIPYGMGPGAEVAGRLIQAGPDGMSFLVTVDGGDFGRFSIRATGDHNLRNALSAVAVGRVLGLGPEEIARGLAAFDGVRRRQEVRGAAGGVTVIDDFAHHPTAVRETIRAIKARFPGQRLWAVFEPRTNTTRRDVFQRDYAASFDGADEVLVAPVDHPERAPEGRRFSVERLIADLRARGVKASAQEGVEAIVASVADRARRGDVVLVMSNGGFGGIHGKLLSALESRAAAEAGGRPGAAR